VQFYKGSLVGMFKVNRFSLFLDQSNYNPRLAIMVLKQGFQRNQSLPLLVIWGVCLARNSFIFNEKSMVPEGRLSQSLVILSSFPQESGTIKLRNIQEEDIDITRPWGFFDGASQFN
jgi:hypothetical protein